MDDRQFEVLKRQLKTAEKQVSDLAQKLRYSEGRLDEEQALVRKAAMQRAVVVATLLNASADEAKKIHKAIDQLDDAIKTSERLSESFQFLLRKEAAELEAASAEQARLNQAVGAETASRQFAAEQTWFTGQVAAVREQSAVLRQLLADLNTRAAEFGQKFTAAYGIIMPMLDQLQSDEAPANLEARGQWRPAHGYLPTLAIRVTPMVRR